MSQEIGLAAAFLAGVVSFLSPCILPLIPAYLSFMTGLSASELSEQGRSFARTLVPALLFVAGFSLVFVAFGASASVLGQVLIRYRVVIENIGGLVIIAFGVLMLGIIRVPWLYGEARMDLGKAKSFGRASALVMGMAFAAGWTPCIGPVLGSILLLAGSSGEAGRGALLLGAYSLGLGVPFMAVALLFAQLTPAIRWMNTRALVLNRVAGVILIVVGAFIFTGRLATVATWMTGLF